MPVLGIVAVHALPILWFVDLQVLSCLALLGRLLRVSAGLLWGGLYPSGVVRACHLYRVSAGLLWGGLYLSGVARACHLYRVSAGLLWGGLYPSGVARACHDSDIGCGSALGVVLITPGARPFDAGCGHTAGHPVELAERHGLRQDNYRRSGKCSDARGQQRRGENTMSNRR